MNSNHENRIYIENLEAFLKRIVELYDNGNGLTCEQIGQKEKKTRATIRYHLVNVGVFVSSVRRKPLSTRSVSTPEDLLKVAREQRAERNRRKRIQAAKKRQKHAEERKVMFQELQDNDHERKFKTYLEILAEKRANDPDYSVYNKVGRICGLGNGKKNENTTETSE